MLFRKKYSITIENRVIVLCPTNLLKLLLLLSLNENFNLFDPRGVNLSSNDLMCVS
jgi:hypothetical protein